MDCHLSHVTDYRRLILVMVNKREIKMKKKFIPMAMILVTN